MMRTIGIVCLLMAGIVVGAQTNAAPELRGSSWRVKWMGKQGERVKEMRGFEPVLDFYKDGKWFLLYDQGTFRGGKYDLPGERVQMVNDDGSPFLTFDAEWKAAENRMVLQSGKTVWRLEFRRKTNK